MKLLETMSLQLIVTFSCSLQYSYYVGAFSFGSTFRSLITASGSKGSFTPPLPPPPPINPRLSFGGDLEGDDFVTASILGMNFWTNQEEHNEDEEDDEANCANSNDMSRNCDNLDDTLIIRGGSDDIIAGTKSTLQTTTNYWSNAFESFQSQLSSTMQRLNPLSRHKGENASTDDEPDLSTMPVQNVEAPGSTVLPDTIVRSAGQRSGLVGSVMRSDRVQECAKHIKKWYLQRGYVLHAVTGATLHSENGTATLTVQEPRSSSLPVDIKFFKLAPIDPENGKITTLRKYKEKIEREKGRVFKTEEWEKVKAELNTTLIESKGRTNPRTISKRLGLREGGHFKWDGQLWQNIAQSGIFDQVWKAGPVKMTDGSVQLQILAQEAAPRTLEYGIQKSLYTGHYEGEIDFKHENVLGGGESLGVHVRRGPKDPIPSVKLQFTDDKFGTAGGYDAQLFSEYIALEQRGDKAANSEEASDPAITETEEEEETPLITASATYNDDEILSRKGLRFNLRSPFSQKLMERSSASTSLERTSTRTGRHETIASGTIGLGPFVRNLPLGAKTSVSTKVTSGTRIGGDNDSSWRLFPYSSQISTAKQLFPILTETLSFPSGEEIKLAFETTLTSSSRHLPRHEANAVGLAARVRGYSSSLNGPLRGSLFGSSEVRIPVRIEKGKLKQDGKVVLFGDWMFGFPKKDKEDGSTVLKQANNIMQKSSMGIGFRTTLQGIPLKYDLSLSKEGKIGASVGLGHDWSIN